MRLEKNNSRTVSRAKKKEDLIEKHFMNYFMLHLVFFYIIYINVLKDFIKK